MNTDEAIAWLLGRGHFSCLDEDGRPLGEQASAAYADCERKEEVRLFGDSRDATGLPCNLLALAQLQGTWPMLLSWVSTFALGSPRTMARSFERAFAGRNVAPLRALRGAVPTRFEAATYKATLGFGEISAWLLMSGEVEAESAPPETKQLDVWLDERPWLIGESQVCGGTRVQIRRFWEALASDGPPNAEALEALDEAWFLDALSASVELETLAASAAGAARALRRAGKPVPRTALRLFEADDVPRLVESLRQVPDAALMHPTLLFAPDEVPDGLRGFIEQVLGGADLDEALLSFASAPAERLASALGFDATPLTLAAFDNACA